MTYRELYLTSKNRLTAAGVDSPADDTMLLLQHVFGINRQQLSLHGENSPAEQDEIKFLRAVAQRENRYPLQYILGEWEFMGLTLSVGEGVLVPREDTGILVESLAARLKSAKSPTGLDLCAGTGAVALGICSMSANTRVTCLELSDEAFPYLQKNIAAHPQFNVFAEKGDVLNTETAKRFPLKSLDFIVSNPPYIKDDELPTLQAEVQKEPSMALSGGKDGLVFYRAITEIWLPLIKVGGFLAVEIGEDQGRAVSAMFTSVGLENVEVLRDWAGLDRCVIGQVSR